MTIRPLAVAHAVLPVDNGHFWLHDGTGDGARAGDALDDATASGRFVGTAGGVVTVVTPSEDSTGTPVEVEVWQAEPPSEDPAGPGWDHEVDLDLDLHTGRLDLELSTDQGGSVNGIPRGPYRLRVSGGGFAPLSDHSEEPQERYRLRLWPRSRDEAPVVRTAWPGWEEY